jgi:hypothetical protein
MSKGQDLIIILQRDGRWTLRFGGDSFDEFSSQDEAIERAIEWARNAEKQGHRVSVLLEGNDGQTTPVWLHGTGAN